MKTTIKSANQISLSIFVIARRNLRRRIFRSLSIVLSVAIVGATLFSTTSIIYSFERGIRKVTTRLGADIMVIPSEAESKARRILIAGEPSTFYMDKAVEAKIGKIKGVRGVSSQIFLKTLRLGCCTIGDVLLIGFDPENDFTIKPWLEGILKRPLKSNEVIIGDSLIGLIIEGRVSPDSEGPSIVRLFSTDFTIAGMLDDTGIEFINNSIFLTYDALRRITDNEARIEDVHLETVRLIKNMISTVFVRIDPSTSPSNIAMLIEDEVEGVKAIEAEKVISSVRKELFLSLKGVLAVSIILWGMAFTLIGIVFSMIVNERKNETGLLRTLGAKRVDIFKLYIIEASLLSVTGAITGGLFGNAFFNWFIEPARSITSIPYLVPSILDIVILTGMSLLLSMITGIGGALLPALRAMMMEPYDAVRNG
jgi:putative ABC transport system permease protein